MCKIFVFQLANGDDDENGPWVQMPDLVLGVHGEAVSFAFDKGKIKGGGLATAAALIEKVGGDWDQYPIDMPKFALSSLADKFYDPKASSGRYACLVERIAFCKRLPQHVLNQCSQAFSEQSRPMSEAESGNSEPPSES